MTPDDDPLESADIGDTATVTVTRELWVGDLEADACRGGDRLADSEVVATEIVTDEHGDEHLAVTVESEVTKRLPHRWDTCREPRTETERRSERRSRWVGHAITLGVTALTFGLGIAITNRVFGSLAGEMTINGDPVATPPLAPVVGIVGVLALVVVAMPHLPGMVGGVRR